MLQQQQQSLLVGREYSEPQGAGSGDGQLHLQSLSREQVRDNDGVTNSAGGVVAQICCFSSALQRLENWMELDTLLCPVFPVRQIPWQWQSCWGGA